MMASRQSTHLRYSSGNCCSCEDTSKSVKLGRPSELDEDTKDDDKLGGEMVGSNAVSRRSVGSRSAEGDCIEGPKLAGEVDASVREKLEDLVAE